MGGLLPSTPNQPGRYTTGPDNAGLTGLCLILVGPVFGARRCSKSASSSKWNFRTWPCSIRNTSMSKLMVGKVVVEMWPVWCRISDKHVKDLSLCACVRAKFNLTGSFAAPSMVLLHNMQRTAGGQTFSRWFEVIQSSLWPSLESSSVVSDAQWSCLRYYSSAQYAA
jgi:hypothetical protein